jgi:N-acyl-D-amino-acid deacylase
VSEPARPYDLVIRGGTLYDGTGAPGVRADVAVAGDRIAAVGPVAERGRTEIDAGGMAVAPGFIDVHSHDDFAVLLDPEMPCKVMQGVTTDVVGNCGSGVVPFEAGLQRFRRLHPEADPAPWQGFAGYLGRVAETRPSLNVAVLMGHGTLRHGAMGVEPRPPRADELDRMRDGVREGAAAGAVGLSTGLIYEPGRYAATEEIVALAQALGGPAGGLYATHMRNEAEGLLAAVREAIRIGEEAGVPVQISHHKASGRANWGRVRESIRLIEEARARGLDVTADQYPYTAGSTSLAAVVQNGAFRRDSPGGIGQLAAADVLVAAAPLHPAWEGRTLATLAEEWGLDTEAAAERLVAEEGQACFVVLFTMSEDDVRTVLAHPTTMIGSDGVPAGSKPHPRLYGCFPRVLGHYVREGVLDLAAAVHRMTGMPAAKFRLTARGIVRPGAFADLVVFDPARIGDTATYDDPRRFPVGIHSVYVNGVAVAREGRHTGARPGRALRRAVA